MPDRGRGDRLFPRPHAVNPIADVFVRYAGVFRLVGRRRGILNQLRRVTGQLVAVDLDLSLFADKYATHLRSLVVRNIHLENRATGKSHRDLVV